MDKRTRYARLMKFIDELPNEKIHSEKMKNLIKMKIASTNKLVEENFKLMLELGLIKEIKPFVFIKNQNGKML